MDLKKPLTLEEVKAASDKWVPLYKHVRGKLPDGASVEETLLVMDRIAKLATHMRAMKERDERDARFGFNKNQEE